MGRPQKYTPSLEKLAIDYGGTSKKYYFIVKKLNLDIKQNIRTQLTNRFNYEQYLIKKLENIINNTSIVKSNIFNIIKRKGFVFKYNKFLQVKSSHFYDRLVYRIYDELQLLSAKDFEILEYFIYKIDHSIYKKKENEYADYYIEDENF